MKNRFKYYFEDKITQKGRERESSIFCFAPRWPRQPGLGGGATCRSPVWMQWLKHLVPLLCKVLKEKVQKWNSWNSNPGAHVECCCLGQWLKLPCHNTGPKAHFHCFDIGNFSVENEQSVDILQPVRRLKHCPVPQGLGTILCCSLSA